MILQLKKTFSQFLILAFCLVGFAACTQEDEGVIRDEGIVEERPLGDEGITEDADLTEDEGLMKDEEGLIEEDEEVLGE